MNIDKRGSITIEAALVLPLAVVFLVGIALGIYSMGTKIALTKLCSDVVNLMATEATVHNLRLTNGSDQGIVWNAVDRCWKQGILDKERILIINCDIPYNGDNGDIVLALSYDLRIGGVFESLLQNPVVDMSQKSWIDPRVDIQGVKKLLLGHIFEWSTSNEGIENKPLEDSIVYVTKTGKKYHKGWCNCLRYSSIEMEFQEAIAKGYTPCEFCVLMTAEIIGYPLEK